MLRLASSAEATMLKDKVNGKIWHNKDEKMFNFAYAPEAIKTDIKDSKDLGECEQLDVASGKSSKAKCDSEMPFVCRKISSFKEEPKAEVEILLQAELSPAPYTVLISVLIIVAVIICGLVGTFFGIKKR
jgi:hypothetical protein